LIISKFIIEEACNFHCKENKNKKTPKISGTACFLSRHSTPKTTYEIAKYDVIH
jgi:hypothetical protein